MKLLASSLFKNAAPEPTTKTASSSWPWPSCTQTRTVSFRNPGKGEIFKTINSAYDDNNNTPESFFTNSSEGCGSFSTVVSEDEDPIETVITKGLTSSDRLFFHPGESRSILDKDPIHETCENKDEDGDKDEDEDEDDIPFKESVALSMDSPDPYVDFRKSMEEMVEAHGLKDWEDLEELLCWYLRVNGKSNHGYIVGAFVDLLVGIAFRTSTISNTLPFPSPSPSPSPSSSSPCCNSCSDEYYSPSTPLSFYTTTTSCSSSSTSTPCNVSSIGHEEGSSEISTNTIPYLSSLLEAEEEINEDDDGASS